MMLKAINPTTGEPIKEYDELTPEQARDIIDRADEAFRHWRTTGFAERAEAMNNAARILRERVEEYARLMAQEMGKPIREARAEVNKCAWVCEYYAQHAEQFLRPEVVETDASKSYVAFNPLGVILAIMPWNFP
ncbi:MAG: aldehyde dehydrogenase family protein, partial [Acidobacteria bacterium]